MEKTIKIGDKDVRLKNNVSWTIIYRDQFGRDIVPTIIPLFASALDVISGIINETGKTDSISIEDVAKIADGDALLNAAIHLGGFEFTDFVCMTWALAKCADGSIPEPRQWVEQFDEFPVDIVAPAVFKLIFKGMVSSKNLARLKDLSQRIQPTSTSTQSSSQASSAG